MTATHGRAVKSAIVESKFQNAKQERIDNELKKWGGVVDHDGNVLAVGDLVCCIGEPGKDQEEGLIKEGVYMQFLEVKSLSILDPDLYGGVRYKNGEHCGVISVVIPDSNRATSDRDLRLWSRAVRKV